MIGFRRRTRETARHERATVLQQLGAAADDPRAWQARRELEVSRMERAHKGGGGHHAAHLGLVTEQGAGGTPSPDEPQCSYCNDQAGGCWYCGRG